MKTISYHEVQQKIKSSILDGLWGEKLPSYRVLANEYLCSINTVKRAVSNLANESLVEIKEKVGVFVQSPGQKLAGKLIAVFIPETTHHLWLAALNSIEQSMHEFGMSLVTVITNLDIEKLKKSVENLANLPVAGVIIVPFGHNEMETQEFENVLNMYMSKQVKIVFLDRYIYHFNIPYATSDNASGAYRLTKLLIENGHKNIMFVRVNKTIGCMERMLGFNVACADHGISDTSFELYIQTEHEDFKDEIDVIKQKIIQAIEQKSPSAIFTCNDQAANVVLKALEEMGKSVPGDISLVTFDVGGAYDTRKYSITGVKQDFNSMGKASSQILLSQILHDETPQSIIVPITVVNSNSVQKIN